MTTDYSVESPLQIALEQGCCERVCKPQFTVLFRRGEKNFGMFLILSGKVSLEVGFDSPLARSYGPGALLGLPSTIAGHYYSMTATVAEDAELGFWSPEALEWLLLQRPDLCQELLELLGERLIENNELQKAIMNGDEQPPPRSRVV